MQGNLAGLDFNPEQHQDDAQNDPFGLMPLGWYPAIIESQEWKPNSAGNGHFLGLVIQITGDYMATRKMFVNLNLDHPNPEAVRIAKIELTRICNAIGFVGQLNDGELLVNKAFCLHVGAKKRKDTGEMENVCKQYKLYDPALLTGQYTQPPGAAPATPGMTPPPPAAPAPAPAMAAPTAAPAAGAPGMPPAGQQAGGPAWGNQ